MIKRFDTFECFVTSSVVKSAKDLPGRAGQRLHIEFTKHQGKSFTTFLHNIDIHPWPAGIESFQRVLHLLSSAFNQIREFHLAYQLFFFIPHPSAKSSVDVCENTVVIEGVVATWSLIIQKKGFPTYPFKTRAQLLPATNGEKKKYGNDKDKSQDSDQEPGIKKGTIRY